MKKHLIFLLIPLFLLSLNQEIQAQKTNFDYLDVYDLQFVDNPQISPDGNTIIYVRHQFDVMTDRRYTNLWSISFSGDEHEPLTSGKSSYGTPTWSPDGSKIAYTSSEEGSSQIFVRWMDRGVTSSITNLTHSPGNLQWSPDGTKLLFTMRLPSDKPQIANLPSPPKGAKWADGATVIDYVQFKADGRFEVLEETYSHIYMVSAEGGAPRKLTGGNYNHSSPSWTPDGESILFTADRTGNADLDPNNEQIFEMDITSGELNQITDKRGPHSNPKISPDGQYIAYTGYEDEFVGYQLTDLYIMNRDGSNLQKISDDLGVDIGNITWAGDSRSLFFLYDEEGNTKVGNIRLNGDISTLVSNLGTSSIGRPYGGGSYSVAENGRFAITSGATDRPTELAVGHYPTRMAVTQITNLNEVFLSSKQLGETTEFWVDSSVDDFEVQGWIITPPDFDPNKKYPMILEIHGGPYTNYGARFTPELQLMAAKGFVVVYTNPRGSTSYSSDFASYINLNYPSEDYNDLMDAVDYVVGQGYIDEEKLYITGGSGGGVLSSWAVGHTDRFAAAVVAKPVINWYSFVLTSDGYPFFNKYWFSEYPWDDPEQYLERSPISYVGNVTTPTMLLVGEYDYRTPVSESEQFYQALKLQGVPSALVKISDSSHSIASTPSNLIRKVAYILGWFEKY
ncbi:S9 family peptidase [Rhodohalobacter sp. 614A]|uniref:S9 family peptidase n=1 Tax=Rhodohalobacter sp. 614A TaxID=2908649 RepID=UPI001F2297CF|nr:S9 family peptidase [Rhodohalobacter sp. 614A]